MKKTAFVAIVGRPNVGKSTLLNKMLGEKVSIVSSKPQTTRSRITGILTRGEEQYVFLDTPGIHKPRTKLGDYMVKSAEGSMVGCDAAILVAEADKPAGEIETSIIGRLNRAGTPIILALNKIDRSDPESIAKSITSYAEISDYAAVVPISALKGRGVDEVLDETSKLLHEGEWFFPDGEITDMPERTYSAEIIREKLLRLLNEEIPHGTAVVVEEFKENKSRVSIRAEIYCERETHKKIIIGHGGEMIKKIGQYAREDLEEFFGVPVYVDLWVKVKENWRDRGGFLKDFGYDPKNLV
ncbi:MAG: GTPase Era [Clostridiales bacterium]|nr:GTPase Era [Clostridiales bacterium]MCD8312119.1 GTPase Era [Bacillota bacterium]